MASEASRPIKELFNGQILILDWVGEPIFKLGDVAKYVGDQKPDRTTSDFDGEMKTIVKYHDGKQSRKAAFLTEDGLYEYMMVCKYPKGKEFRRMVRRILKQIREKVVSDLHVQLFKIEERLDEVHRYQGKGDTKAMDAIWRWLAVKNSESSCETFYDHDLQELTVECVRKCLHVGLGDYASLLMEEAYDCHVAGDENVGQKPLHAKFSSVRR